MCETGTGQQVAQLHERPMMMTTRIFHSLYSVALLSDYMCGPILN